MPHSSHTHQEKEAVASMYLAMCEIGGMMGVYAGFSMITFAQILGYGGYVGWSKIKEAFNKRKGQVHPAPK